MFKLTEQNKIAKTALVAVVVPAYNEEKLIARVLTTLPDFVDQVIVVDDGSKDRTAQIVKNLQSVDKRIFLIRLPKNQGVGGAIAAGYEEAVGRQMDVTVVAAGDGQMDPADMVNLVKPVASGEVDYAKGNRLFRGESWDMIPHYRYLGNSFLSLLTKFASGYWHIADSQTGYTAISLAALKTLNLKSIYKKYGMPNDMLIKLNIFNFRVRDVSVRPVYGKGESSGIRIWKVAPRICWLLIRGFCKRLWLKYVVRDFHPLVFFYLMAFLLFLMALPLFVRLLWLWFIFGFVPQTTALALMFAVIAGLQSLFFAMWFDMENNKHLK